MNKLLSEIFYEMKNEYTKVSVLYWKLSENGKSGGIIVSIDNNSACCIVNIEAVNDCMWIYFISHVYLTKLRMWNRFKT